MTVITLKHPVDIAGRRYEALTVRRARAGDVRVLDRSGALALIAQIDGAAGAPPALPAGFIDACAPFLARIADVDEAVIDALDAEDFVALFELLGGALPTGPLLPATSTA